MGKLLHNVNSRNIIIMYLCICLVARINQRVFRNSSLQMCSMRVRQMMLVTTGGPPQELGAKRLVIINLEGSTIYKVDPT